jgi:hypothetical protein
MALSDGREVCLNLNDALHAAPVNVQSRFVALLKRLYPTIDYVFCGYGIASHFPNCYIVPGVDRAATAARRQRYFNRQWAKLISQLQPRFGFPFAADVALLEDDLFWANEPTHNSERPTDVFRREYPNATATTLDIAPGFVIESGEIKAEAFRKPLSAQRLRTECASQIERANRYGSVDDASLSEIEALLDKSLSSYADYLKSYEGDYRMLIRFRNGQAGICIHKNGQDLGLTRVPIVKGCGDEYDLVYTTRIAYLKWSLTRPYGDEILFVGSGGIFEYCDPAKVSLNLHRELIQIVKRADRPLKARSRRSSGLLAAAKEALKKVVRGSEHDLYDLGQWSVHSSPTSV